MLFICLVLGKTSLKRQLKEGGVYFGPQLAGKGPNVCGKHGARSLAKSSANLHLQSARGEQCYSV